MEWEERRRRIEEEKANKERAEGEEREEGGGWVERAEREDMERREQRLIRQAVAEQQEMARWQEGAGIRDARVQGIGERRG